MQLKKKSTFIKDPIHGEINFSENDVWLWEILFTNEFQRLNRIRQLGLSYQLFPSATHTRFSHSIGVYETARRFIDNLKIKNLTPKKRKVILAAALLHDIGHGPNSHAFEKYTNISHETYTKMIISNKNGSIYKILTKNNVPVKDVLDILDKKSKNEWMNSLVSSQIDVDRIDYLQRDSHYTGATYGEIDSSMIARRAMFMNNQIVFSLKAISTIENFLIGRFHMYEQVYENVHTIANEWIIQQIMTRVKELYKSGYKFVDYNNLLELFNPWLNDRLFTVEEFIKLDDWNLSVLLDSLKHEKDPILKTLLEERDTKNKYVCIDYTKKDYQAAIAKAKKLKMPIKYNIDIIKHKAICLYDPNKQPIKIYNSLTKKIENFDTLSNIVSKNQFIKKERTLLIINSKLIKYKF